MSDRPPNAQESDERLQALGTKASSDVLGAALAPLVALPEPDGVTLEAQYALVVALMEGLEESLSDEQQATLAELVVELTAYNVMSALELMSQPQPEVPHET